MCSVYEGHVSLWGCVCVSHNNHCKLRFRTCGSISCNTKLLHSSRSKRRRRLDTVFSPKHNVVLMWIQSRPVFLNRWDA
jgi:hypothetical protein